MTELEVIQSIRVNQANISALNPKKLSQSSVKQGCSYTPRMVLLDSLFSNAGADIVCVQEGRLPQFGSQRCFFIQCFGQGQRKMVEGVRKYGLRIDCVGT